MGMASVDSNSKPRGRHGGWPDARHKDPIQRPKESLCS